MFEMAAQQIGIHRPFAHAPQRQHAVVPRPRGAPGALRPVVANPVRATSREQDEIPRPRRQRAVARLDPATAGQHKMKGDDSVRRLGLRDLVRPGQLATQIQPGLRARHVDQPGQSIHDTNSL